MDLARCTSKWSCVDIFYPLDIAGFMESVQIEGSTPETPENPDGVQYSYGEGLETVIFGQEINIDRRNI